MIPDNMWIVSLLLYYLVNVCPRLVNVCPQGSSSNGCNQLIFFSLSDGPKNVMSHDKIWIVEFAVICVHCLQDTATLLTSSNDNCR